MDKLYIDILIELLTFALHCDAYARTMLAKRKNMTIDPSLFKVPFLIAQFTFDNNFMESLETLYFDLKTQPFYFWPKVSLVEMGNKQKFPALK